MTDAATAPMAFELEAAWRVEPLLNRLYRVGTTAEVISLEPKVMSVLVVLAQADGRVVRREDILKTVWADVVVGDYVVHRAVSELRKALEDTTKPPQLIETIRGVGYRLCTSVQWLADEQSKDAEAPTPARVRRTAKHAVWIWPMAAVGLGMLLISAVLKSSQVSRPEAFAFQPLTSAVGQEQSPALSPDGQLLAFTQRTPNGPTDLYVRRVGEDDALRLTDDTEHETALAFSPDGTQLAYVRQNSNDLVVVTRSVFGEQVRQRVACVACAEGGLDWSADGMALFYADRSKGEAAFQLYRHDLASAQTEVVRDSGEGGQRWPIVSPDGTRLAFLQELPGRVQVPGLQPVVGQVVVLDMASGKIETWAPESREFYGLEWLDNDTLLGAGYTIATSHALWRITAEGAVIQQAASGTLYGRLAVAAGKGIAVEQWSARTQLRRVNLETLETEAFAASSRSDWWPRASPLGKQVAFVSSRSGIDQVWVTLAESGMPRRLTDFKSGKIDDLIWSPTGAYVAFAHHAEASSTVYVARVGGRGDAQPITDAALNAHSPAFSPDGTHLYYSAWPDGNDAIYRHALHDATVERVRPGQRPRIGPDGRLYFMEKRENAIYRVPLHTPEAEPEQVPIPTNFWATVTFTDVGMVHLAYHDEALVLQALDLETLAVQNQHPFGTDALVVKSGLSVSDGWIYYAERRGLNADLLYATP
ncbi:MAG: hypothetical protein RhofKO_08980 [Rhodothermales bacterium]